MAQYEKGKPKTGGRGKGTRNKFSKRFDDDLRRDYLKHGKAAIETLRIEKPAEYVKLLAMRFPQSEIDPTIDAQILTMRWNNGTVIGRYAKGTAEQITKIERVIVDTKSADAPLGCETLKANPTSR